MTNVVNITIPTLIEATDEADESLESEFVPGRWHLLPFEIVDKIWMFIGDIDMCGYIPRLSKLNTFRPSELCYRYFCENIYVGQTTRGKLRVEKWHSWRAMAVQRPRLRTNGFYCLRTLYSRAPNNDSFWEPKRTQSVETCYYRYMRFFNTGQVLYALTTTNPTEMSRLLRPGLPEDKRIFMGYYRLTGRRLEVDVKLHYCTMHFILGVHDADPSEGWVGKHNALHLEGHSCSSVQTNTPSRDERVLFHHSSVDAIFQYWRQWYW